MISKGTFYAHYLDKYDLAEQLIDRELKFFENLLFQRFQTFSIHSFYFLEYIGKLCQTSFL